MPLALLALLLWPIVWLMGVPFRLLGISVSGALELIESIVRQRPGSIEMGDGGGGHRPPRHGGAGRIDREDRPVTV